MQAIKVSEIMSRKLVTASENETLSVAAERMLQSKTSSVLVLSDGKPVGIVTEKDFVKFFAFKVPYDEPLKNHMSRNLVTVDEDTSVNDARNILVTHRIRHLPVVNKNGEAVGMITVRDILESVQTLF